MRILTCAVLLAGCSGTDCAVLAARYAEAFREAQQCVPGQDTCTASAASAAVNALPDGGSAISIDMCMNSCGGPNVNPKRTEGLKSLLDAYIGTCENPMGCLCAQPPDGGWPTYTCKPVAGGGGVCSL